MTALHASLSVKGKLVEVPAYAVDGRIVVVPGTWLKIARMHEEEWLEHAGIVDLPAFLTNLQSVASGADIFTFAPELSETPQPKYSFPSEEDDVAAVKITTFKEWWEALPQESRKNVRKAEKRGVITRLSVFDDAFVSGIKAIYDETPVRQGRHFWHYGKDLDAVKRENATYLERSDFVAAYLGDELIGFIKIVYVGKCARIMQIISKNAHADKKTPNALLAKAVEVCADKGMSYFVYGKYFYGSKGHTPIAEFKRRNGFERIVFRRYFIPLTLKGKAAIGLKLHLGVGALLPASVTKFLLTARAKFLANRTSTAQSARSESSSAPTQP